MSRLPDLSICLVRSSAGTTGPWPFDALTAHLQELGHRVDSARKVTARALSTYDVVHGFGLSAADVDVAGQAARLLVTPSIADFRDPAAVSVRPDVLRAASAVVHSRTDQDLVHRLGVPWYRTWVLPAGVEVETFARLGPMANRTERFRLVAELGDEDDRLETVLAALVKLDEAELVVLGRPGGRRGASSARAAAFRSSAAAAGVGDRVVLVAPRSDGERAWWLRSGHVAVAVPRSVAASDFVAQAMACGTAVVASPVGAVVDLIVHGVTGFQVPADDPLSVVRAVRMVLQDDFTVESYGMAAADRALSRFAWPRVVHELVGVYRRVTARACGLEDAPDDADEAVADEGADVLDRATSA